MVQNRSVSARDKICQQSRNVVSSGQSRTWNMEWRESSVIQELKEWKGQFWLSDLSPNQCSRAASQRLNLTFVTRHCIAPPIWRCKVTVTVKCYLSVMWCVKILKCLSWCTCFVSWQPILSECELQMRVLISEVATVLHNWTLSSPFMDV